MPESRIVPVQTQRSPYSSGEPLFRYIRESFYSAGIEDWTKPPAQNPDSFVTLQNVLPVTKGRLRRRFGYTTFALGLGFAPQRIYTYKGNPNKAAATRFRYIYTAPSAIKATDENGTITNTGIFTPGTSAVPPRSVVSRDYAFFLDGVGSSTTVNIAGTTVTRISGDSFITGTSWKGAALNVINAGPIGVSSVTDVNHLVLMQTPGTLNNVITQVPDTYKWTGEDSGGLSRWGIMAPVVNGSAAPGIAGNVTLTKGRLYAVVFRNSITGTTSDLPPLGDLLVGPVTGVQVNLSNLPTSPDPQVDSRVIIATTDGFNQATWYQVGIIKDNTTTTFTDNISETNLVVQNKWIETVNGVEIGVTHNLPPGETVPDGTLLAKHKGRIYIANSQAIYFSKTLSDTITSTGTITGRWEECFPPQNAFTLPAQFQGNETITGMLSDGQFLYIGTDKGVYRLVGDPIINNSTPELIFGDIGVLNQETWQLVYLEGRPIGAMWLTKDFRVILSDMNTYNDVGYDIKNSLSNITLAQATKSFAVYYGHLDMNFYWLHLPIGGATDPNQSFIFDVRTKKWYQWLLNDIFSAALYEIFPNSSIKALLAPTGTGIGLAGTIYNTDETLLTDAGATTAVTVTTPFLDLGDPSTRKFLNEIEVHTGDSALFISVSGANTEAQFTTPVNLLTNASLVTDELGDFKLYLAGLSTKYRWYQFSFLSSFNTIDDVLSYYHIEAFPIVRF